MRVGILGSGVVARTLGGGFLGHGHEVMLGSRTPEKLADWVAEHDGGQTGTFAAAAAFGEIVVLAVKGSAASEALHAAEAANLAGKVVIDATNPIADSPPEQGVLRFFTTLDDSLMERLQRQFPEARLVKAFNSVGSALMVDPQLPGGRPTMFVCGNDEGGKRKVIELLDDFGWDSEDLGGAAAARALEPLCILWCIPGFLRNDWMHAYKVLRPSAH